MTNRICVLSCCLVAATLSAFSPVAAGKPETRDRAEIPDAYKWDVSKIYPSWEAWESDLKLIDGYIKQYVAFKGTLADGPQNLAKVYELDDEIGRLAYKLYRYPQLQRDVDLRNTDASGKLQRVSALFAKLGTATSWFTPELLQVPEATTMEWINAEPKLAPYRFPISETYRQAAHTLNEDGEKLMSYSQQFRGTPSTIYQELSTSDVQFPTIKLSDGREVKVSYGGYMEVLSTARNQADREAAFKGQYGTFAANKNTYAAIYNGILQRDWFSAQARSYPTTLAAALDGDNVPESVYRTLVETVRAGTGPLQRYFKVKQRMLGVETFHLYDSMLPLIEDNTRYPYDDMKAVVYNSVAPLGAEYQGKMLKLLNERCLDVYESDGKRSGAYSAGVYGVGPYMLMNYNDTLDAVFTFAHEAGHSMHTVLSHETQPFATASYTIFVAEVASTTNERFLLESLLSRTEDPKERFLLLQHAIDNIMNTFYLQVMFADYEWQAHQLVEAGQPVTSDSLAKIYSGLLDTYYGDAVAKDELYRYTWTRIPHFYNSPYYVYKYATCFASSAQLFKAMMTGPETGQAAARERYLTLLRSGGNDQPMAQLLKAGVDLNKRETIQAVVDQMDELVTRLEAEAAKIQASAKPVIPGA
ncbi:MAG: oligoendopeptidase F [Cephaloticoccus sp.]|nr:oligoendopeptidase F [Cephaloticoccus sp.]MCF7760899.1 oligoendopeptidase F [Cephaloticoccus sp.]